MSTMTLSRLLSIPEPDRGLTWLKRSLQIAVKLELSTIPPYLVAMWSIRNQRDQVAESIKRVVVQEMLHMGFACNLLTTLDKAPRITAAAPIYPGELSGEIHPGLTIQLERISQPLVENVFMEIEEPDTGDVKWHRGRAYPTIGAFYDAIYRCFDRIRPNITGCRQRTMTHAMNLTKITTLQEALDAVKLIKEQGEGTAASPLYGPSKEDLAHYFRFGEILHMQRIEERNCVWDYTGAALPFPNEAAGEIFPMAPIPAAGYPGVSDEFDRLYSGTLRELDLAWEAHDETEGQDHLSTAYFMMVDEMPTIGRNLMQQPISSSSANTYGPCFRVI